MRTLDRAVLPRFAAIGVIALAAFSCSKRSYKMPSGSMFPTFPLESKFVADTSARTPARGEVWVLHSPEHPEQEFVKRVVGLGGDRVEMRGDALMVNAKPVRSCTVGAYSPVFDGAPHPGRLVLEQLEVSAYLTFLEDLPTAGPGPAGPWWVPAGEVFVIGDNRQNSFDSRMWKGGIGAGAAQSLLIGRAEVPPLALPPDAAALAGAFAKCKAELGVSQ
jgi:signal peptidase I